MVEELNEKKSIYFVILIVILIILAIVLTIHFNNKEFVDLKEFNVKTTTKAEKDEVTTTVKTTNQIKTTEKVVYLKKSSVEEEFTTYSDSDIDTNLVISFVSNKKLSLNVKKYDIDDNLKSKNILSLYDVSLFDNDKYVNIQDNNITIKIPFNSNNYNYDYYKIAYLNDNNEILEYIEPTLRDGYIIFNTTHLSKYGIVGFKKEIDLSKTIVNLYKNNILITDYSNVFKLSKNDLLNIVVNTDYKDYKVEYSLRSDKEFSYQSFDINLLNKVNDTKQYTLMIKVIIGDKEKIFELIKFRVFDIIVSNEFIEKTVYEAKENKEEEIVIDDLNETDLETTVPLDYTFQDKEKNKDILIDIDKEKIKDQEVTINVKGNIYVLDETDLSNLELTGYLNIETSDNVIFKKIENEFDLDDLISVEINTDLLIDKKFVINDVEYTYEINDGILSIKKIIDNQEVENLFEKYNQSYQDNKIIFNKINN